MTFTADTLEDDGTILKDADRIDVKVVYGNDQWVYWKGCSGLSSVENGKKKMEGRLTGKAKLQVGIALYFVGGQVKEVKEE